MLGKGGSEVAVNSFEIELRMTDGRAVLDLHGDVDAYTGQRLTEYIDAAVTEHAGDVHLNLAKVRFVDSSGIAVFVAAAKRLRERGDQLVVRAPQASVAKIFEITGVDKLVKLERNG